MFYNIGRHNVKHLFSSRLNWNLKMWVLDNGTVHFAYLSLDPIEVSSEEVNKVKILKKKKNEIEINMVSNFLYLKKLQKHLVIVKSNML